MRIVVLTVLVILFADQGLKIWVKLNMLYNESIPIFGDWFSIHFVENPGMAFGIEWGGYWGKKALTIFRILAISGIGYYLYGLIKNNADKRLLLIIAMIFAGAVGNILDSVFYGVIFSESTPYKLAEFFPQLGGYSSVFHGNVVDMLYFPLIKGNFPEWFPVYKNESFVFFRPIFNIADSAISVGVMLLIALQKKLFKNT